MCKKLFALLLAGSAAAMAHAQQPASADDEQASSEIVVEGVRDPSRQIRDFVNSLTKAPVRGQISRFDWAVCPAVVGLGDVQSAAVAERMRQVARTAGMKVAANGCQPNALVILTGDKKELIKQLKARHPAYFEGLSDSHVRRMLQDPSPAAAWHVEGLLDADGIEVPRDAVTGQRVVQRTDMASRLSMMTRPHFVASVVVIEIDSLAGLTVTQLGDYASMRAFARTDPSRLQNAAVPSILTILDAPMNSAVPITLTEWDLAYLKALYGSAENRLAAQQRSDMQRLMREELRKSKAARE